MKSVIRRMMCYCQPPRKPYDMKSLSRSLFEIDNLQNLLEQRENGLISYVKNIQKLKFYRCGIGSGRRN
eukprot:UN09545